MQVRLIPGDGTSAIALRKPATVVGRARAMCDLVLDSKAVSKRHCELRLEHRQLVVRDLGSRNGTWINGRRISEAELQPGDELKISQIVFRVEMDWPEHSTQADTDADGPSAPCAANQEELQEDGGGHTGLPEGDWFVRMGGQDRGPLSVDELQELAEKQVVGPFSLLKCGSESEWYPAQMIAGALFAADSRGTAGATAPRPHSLGHARTRRAGNPSVRPFRPPTAVSALNGQPPTSQSAMECSHEETAHSRATEPDETIPLEFPPLSESILIPGLEPQTSTSETAFPSEPPRTEFDAVAEEAVAEDAAAGAPLTLDEETETGVPVRPRAQELAEPAAALTEAAGSSSFQPQPADEVPAPDLVAKVSRTPQFFSVPSTPNWLRGIHVIGVVYHPAFKVVVGAVLVLLAFCWILSGSDETTYDTLQGVYQELRAKRGGNTSQADWNEFKTHAENRLDALIAELGKTASSQAPTKQVLLWAGGDLRTYMLVRTETSRSENAERKFLIRMREARAAMDGVRATHPRVVQNDLDNGPQTMPSPAVPGDERDE